MRLRSLTMHARQPVHWRLWSATKDATTEWSPNNNKKCHSILNRESFWITLNVHNFRSLSIDTTQFDNDDDDDDGTFGAAADATIRPKNKHRKDCYILVDHQNTKFKCATSSFARFRNKKATRTLFYSHANWKLFSLFLEMFTLTRHKLNYTINLSVFLLLLRF